MLKLSKTILLLLCVLITYTSKAQLVLQPNLSPTQAVSNVLAAFGGGTISNVTYTGDTAGIGGFTAYGTNLGLDCGVILASGTILNAKGPNISPGITTAFNTAGDPDLTALAGVATNDAAVLEFDYVPNYPLFSFDYVFGSDEYDEFVGSFNDVFAFFITGPKVGGGSYTNYNIARLPTSTTASNVVSINNVNNGNTNTGPCVNCTYYTNNATGTTIEYDAFTVPLTTEVLTLIPGQSYHIKLAVADAIDEVLDSGVFIRFSTSAIPPLNITGLTNVPCGTAFNVVGYGVSPKNTTAAYTWTVNGGTILSGQGTDSIRVDWGSSSAGNVFVTQTINAFTGCSYTNSITTALGINIQPELNAPIDFNIIHACVGQPVTLAISQGSILPNLKYEWDFDASVASVDSTHYYFQNITLINHVYNTSGNYTISFTATDQVTGCAKTITKVVKVYDNPIANFIFPKDTVCTANPNTISNISTLSTAYQWQFLNSLNQVVLPPRTDTVNTFFPFAFQNAGTYKIRLIAYNQIGCDDTLEKTITVIAPPVANIMASDTIICQGDAVMFSTSNTGNYMWDFSETGIVSPLYNVSNPSRVFTTPGVYTIYFTTFSSLSGCEGKAQKKIRVLEKPILNLKASDTLSCANKPISFMITNTLTNNGQTYEYNWSFGDGGTSTASNPTHVFSSGGTYWAKLTMTTRFGNTSCSVKDSIKIQIIDTPNIISIASDPRSGDAFPNIPVLFTPDFINNTPPLSFVWAFGDNIGTANTQNPTHQYAQAGTYPVTLVLINGNNCRDTMTYEMIVTDNDALLIPNIITPNNDGKNDEFRVFTKNIKSYHIEIYNRWGKKVFESDSPSEVWNAQEPDGVYFYALQCEGRFGGKYDRKGNLTIMR